MDQNRGSSYVPGRMDVIIKLTQKRMAFKGRATGLHTEVIEQDTETGLINLVPTSVDDTFLAALRLAVKTLGPQASMRALSAHLAEALHISPSTAYRRLKHQQQVGKSHA